MESARWVALVRHGLLLISLRRLTVRYQVLGRYWGQQLEPHYGVLLTGDLFT